MSKHTHFACWIHLIWCTSNRYAYFDESQSKAVSKYLTNYAKSKEISMQINFVNPDHVHALIRMGPTMSIDRTVQLLKGSSSHWINKSELTRTRFEWARGYAALTVSPDAVKSVTRYIAMQKAHHSRVSTDRELAVIARGWTESYRETVETVSEIITPSTPR